MTQSLLSLILFLGSSLAFANANAEASVKLTLEDIKTVNEFQKTNTSGLFKKGFWVTTELSDIDLENIDKSIPRKLVVRFSSRDKNDLDAAIAQCKDSAFTAVAEGKKLSIEIENVTQALIDEIKNGDIVIKETEDGSQILRKVRLTLDMDELSVNCQAE